jgi:fucose permease
LQDAQANGYVASIQRNNAAKMGLIHSIYGVGAFAAPLAATQFAKQRHWSFHFLISIGIALPNVALLLMVFKGRSQDGMSVFLCYHECQQPLTELGLECLKEIGQDQAQDTASDQSYFRRIMSMRSVHVLSAFILIYVGAEVTIGGKCPLT